MILETIEEKLKEIDPYTFYGMVDEAMNEMLWNYTVFARKSIGHSTNKTSYSHVYSVTIVRENFIPEGLELEYIKKMKEIAGMKPADADIVISYVEKPNTNRVVELMTIEFVRAVKV